MQCARCGAENPDHFSFCRRCGQRLAASPAASKPRKSKPFWVLLGLGLLVAVLAALGGTGYWVYKNWKEKQSEEYSPKETGPEKAEDDQIETAPRRSNGSQRLSDAQYYEARSQWDQALAEYKQVLAEDPNSYEAHYGLGNCYRRKHDFSSAKSEYQQAISLNPQYLPARRALARLYARQRDLDAAIEELEAAQSIAPKDLEVARELANYRKRRAGK